MGAVKTLLVCKLCWRTRENLEAPLGWRLIKLHNLQARGHLELESCRLVALYCADCHMKLCTRYARR